MRIPADLLAVFVEQLFELVPDRAVAARFAAAGLDQLEAWQRGERLDEVEREHQLRLGYVHSIYLSACSLAVRSGAEDTDEAEVAWVESWMRRPIAEAPFGGRSPLDHCLADGSWQGMQDVLDWQVDELERLEPACTEI